MTYIVEVLPVYRTRGLTLATAGEPLYAYALYERCADDTVAFVAGYSAERTYATATEARAAAEACIAEMSAS